MLLNEKTSLSFSFMQYYFSILRESCQKKPIFKEAYAFCMMYFKNNFNKYILRRKTIPILFSFVHNFFINGKFVRNVITFIFNMLLGYTNTFMRTFAAIEIDANVLNQQKSLNLFLSFYDDLSHIS